MKITAVEAIMLRWPCDIMSDALSVCTARQALLIKISTDSELYGIGEAFCYGSPLKVGKYIVEEQLAPVLIGQNPLEIERLWQTMYWRTIANGRRGVVLGGISGVDIALWDLMGKIYHMPIHQLLGAHSDRVPSYASGGFYAPGKDLDGLRRELESYREKGYQDIKIKIGRNSDMAGNPLRYMANQEFAVSYEEDMRRLETAREVIGNGRLFADLNASWDADQVIKARKDFENVKLDWLEEPIVFENSEGCKKIAKALRNIRIIGYETEQGVRNFERMIQNNSVDVVQPDVGWCGGISESRKIAALAHANVRPISMHSFGSAVHFAASLQLSAAFPNTEVIESEENQNALKNEIIQSPFEADEKMSFYVPQGDGLGIELNWDRIEELCIKLN